MGGYSSVLDASCALVEKSVSSSFGNLASVAQFDRGPTAGTYPRVAVTKAVSGLKT